MIDTSAPPLHETQIEAIARGLGSEYLPFRMGTGTGKNAVQAYMANMLLETSSVARNKILLLHPNSCLVQTMEEFELWLGTEYVERNVQLLYAYDTKYGPGKTITERAQYIARGEKPIIILGHEALQQKATRAAVKKKRWHAVFLDEASRFRGWTSRTRALLSLGKKADHRYILSGSLVTQSPDDLYYPFLFLSDRYFPYPHALFKREWCEMGGFNGMQAIGTRPDKQEQLTRLLDKWCYTVNLSDMRDDMPDRRIDEPRYVVMTGQQNVAYNELVDTLRLEIECVEDATFELHVDTYVGRMQRLQEISAGFARNPAGDVYTFPESAKTRELVELLSDDPLPTIVWCWWIPEMRSIQTRLAHAGITSVTSKEKDWRQRFKSGDVRVAVLQCSAGGYGLNLDEADRMIYHSLPWSLDVYMQSQERNWRFTTTRPRVVTHLIARGTVDEHVRDRLLQHADTAVMLTRADALRMLTRR